MQNGDPGKIEVMPEMIEVLGDWIADEFGDTAETGLYPGRAEKERVIRRLLELNQTQGRCRSANSSTARPAPR